MILWHVKGHKLKMVRIGDVEKQPFTDHHRCSILLLGGIVYVLYCKKNVACSKSSAQIREMEMQSSFKSLINAKTAEIIQRISQTAF